MKMVMDEGVQSAQATAHIGSFQEEFSPEGSALTPRHGFVHVHVRSSSSSST